jgi:hypothetical protein
VRARAQRHERGEAASLAARQRDLGLRGHDHAAHAKPGRDRGRGAAGARVDDLVGDGVGAEPAGGASRLDVVEPDRAARPQRLPADDERRADGRGGRHRRRDRGALGQRHPGREEQQAQARPDSEAEAGHGALPEERDDVPRSPALLSVSPTRRFEILVHPRAVNGT